MNNSAPYPAEEGIIGVGTGMLLTLITCGLYGIYWQYKQMEILNAWLGRDEYDFWLWLLLGIVTCGLFFLYYEYKMAQGINEVQHKNGWLVNQNLGILCVLLSWGPLNIISIAIQQADINNFYGDNPDL